MILPKILIPLLVNGAIFTFDDGPSSQTTPKILDALKKHKIKAVFCIPASNLHYKQNVRIAKRIIREGHIICSHSYHHVSLKILSKKQQEKQIIKAQKLFEKKLGIKPTLFRPPFGAITRYSRKVLKKQGLSLFMWDIDSHDWKRLSAWQIYHRVINWWKYRRKRYLDSVILFHDINYKTSFILDRLIQKVKKGP